MPDPVSAISSISGLGPLQPLAQAGKPGEFQSVLEGTIQKLESVNNDATDAVQKFLTGENEELHTTFWRRKRRKSPSIWVSRCATRLSPRTRKSCACKCRTHPYPWIN